MAEVKENRRWILARRPNGLPTADDIVIETCDVPKINDGEFLVKVHYLSVDPYQRIVMGAPMGYMASIEIGATIVGRGVASVVESKNPDFPVGRKVLGPFGWTEYAKVNASKAQNVVALPDSITHDSYALGALGMPGLTAYFGLLSICEPEKGKTLFVSGGAGACGSTVGQIGKIEGLRVIGSAGTPQKLEFMRELGFDGVLQYKDENGAKSVEQLKTEIKSLAPEGIDYYFDNTGGPMTEAVIQNMNTYGKISICGGISQYNKQAPAQLNADQILFRQLRVEGFLSGRFAARRAEGFAYLTKHVDAGHIKIRESITEGFDQALSAFLELFSGGNIGKKIVHFSDP